MKITVVGAGAIGGTVGAYMARAGDHIALVDVAADHVAAMKENLRPMQWANLDELEQMRSGATMAAGSSGHA